MKVKTVTHFEVDYNELDRAVSSHFGHPYEVVCDMELNNMSSKTVTVKREPLDEWNTRAVDNFRATGGGAFLLNGLLQQMCNEGVIEPGDYLIDVFW